MPSIYETVEKARKTGKIEKGINEVTKCIERGTAKFVVYAKDVSPVEIITHIPILCKEKKIPYEEADSKEKLGIAVGIKVPCSSVAIIQEGEASLVTRQTKIKDSEPASEKKLQAK